MLNIAPKTKSVNSLKMNLKLAEGRLRNVLDEHHRREEKTIWEISKFKIGSETLNLSEGCRRG